MDISARTQLFLIVVAVFIVEYLPLVNLPFHWTLVFFHEISHGLAAILTGGEIVSIRLHLDGSGLCVRQGGWSPLIAFSGYIGSSISGALMYLMLGQLSRHATRVLLAGFIVLLMISMILWVRDLVSLFIMSGLIAMYAIIWFKQWISAQWFMKFVAVFVMLESVRRPLALIGGAPNGDDVKLYEMTFVPEFVWVFIWMAFALLCLYVVYGFTERRKLSPIEQYAEVTKV